MRRKIVLFIIIAICFLLQTTVFRALTFANIGPNLLIISEDMLYFICTSVTSTDCSKKDFTRMILSFR